MPENLRTQGEGNTAHNHGQAQREWYLKQDHQQCTGDSSGEVDPEDVVGPGGLLPEGTAQYEIENKQGGCGEGHQVAECGVLELPAVIRIGQAKPDRSREGGKYADPCEAREMALHQQRLDEDEQDGMGCNQYRSGGHGGISQGGDPEDEVQAEAAPRQYGPNFFLAGISLLHRLLLLLVKPEWKQEKGSRYGPDGGEFKRMGIAGKAHKDRGERERGQSGNQDQTHFKYGWAVAQNGFPLSGYGPSI